MSSEELHQQAEAKQRRINELQEQIRYQLEAAQASVMPLKEQIAFLENDIKDLRDKANQAASKKSVETIGSILRRKK